MPAKKSKPTATKKKSDSLRPTKRQKALLEFIRAFIAQHGYSPSYREIMKGLDYTSVATVALHINSLIKRGHLVKRDHSARSLEVVSENDTNMLDNLTVLEHEAKWLIDQISRRFELVESNKSLQQQDVDKLFVLVGALKILDLNEAANSFIPRLSVLSQTVK